MARRALSLTKLVDQINSLHPNRNKASDGWLGDAAHASRVSQHNPNAAGVVTAQDITHDPAHGVNGQDLADQLIKDSRAWYVIFNGRIRYSGGAWQPYTGINPHKTHVHLSVKQDAKHYDNPAPWQLTTKEVNMGLTEQQVKELHYMALLAEGGPAYVAAFTGKPLDELIAHFRASVNPKRAAVEKQYKAGATVPALQARIKELEAQLAKGYEEVGTNTGLYQVKKG